MDAETELAPSKKRTKTVRIGTDKRRPKTLIPTGIRSRLSTRRAFDRANGPAFSIFAEDSSRYFGPCGSITIFSGLFWKKVSRGTIALAPARYRSLARKPDSICGRPARVFRC